MYSCNRTRSGCDRSEQSAFHVRLFSAALLAVLFIAVPVAARAKPAFLAAFKSTYSIKTGGNIDSAGCNLCHDGGPPKLNPYGMSLKQALDKAGKRMVDAQVLNSVELQDSDGDGFSNIEEIDADTLPGDKSSHPQGKPKTRATGGTETGEQSPFDIVALITAKHAQHPVVVHFPIGLFIASLLFDLLGRVKKSGALNTAAHYNLAFAAITSVIAVITGIIAWQWKLGGEPLQGNLKLHLIFGIVTCVLIITLWAVRKKGGKEPGAEVTSAYLALAIITAAIIALTGHIGGILSGVA